MATLACNIMVDAPVDKVFVFTLDIGQLWKMKDVALTDVETKPDGVGTWFTFEAADGGTKMTAEGKWIVKVPVVGKPIEGMMVKEHAPYLEGMLANPKTQVEAKAAAA